MDQKKIGVFLKELRKEKELTQEQLAEKFNVSSRTISRWENGNNMPDLDILIEISDFYEVDLREILNGERKSEIMDKETKETVLQAVDYTNTETENNNKKLRLCIAVAMLCQVVSLILRDTSLYNDYTFISIGTDFLQGAGVGMLLMGVIKLSRYGAKIRAFKQRIKKQRNAESNPNR
ncbi:MAG: helix-turn-helix transcriptional regulator [Ruminococcus sp.]|nr:helix-turn-helix transcriptional regulator [Ruminococcus sp.]